MSDYLPIILDATAKLVGLPPELWRKIVLDGERSHEGWQTSPKGAFGPAQLMPATAKETNQKWFDGQADTQSRLGNLLVGAAYAADQWNKYQDPILTAVAYNAGPSRADAYKASGNFNALPAETRGYVQRVGDKKVAENKAKDAFWRSQEKTGGAALANDAQSVWEYLKSLGNKSSEWGQQLDQNSTILGYKPSEWLQSFGDIGRSFLDYNAMPFKAAGLDFWSPPPTPTPAPPPPQPIQSSGMFDVQLGAQGAPSTPNILDWLSQASSMVPSAPTVQPRTVPQPTPFAAPDFDPVFSYIDAAQQARGTDTPAQAQVQIPLRDRLLTSLGTALATGGLPVGGLGQAMLALAGLNQQERDTDFKNQAIRQQTSQGNREAAATFPMAKAKVAESRANKLSERDQWMSAAKQRADYYNTGFGMHADAANASAARGRTDDVYNLTNLIGQVNMNTARGSTKNPLLDAKVRFGGKDVPFGDITAKARATGNPQYAEAALIMDSYRNGAITNPKVQQRLEQFERAYNQVAQIILNAPTGTSAIKPLAQFLRQNGFAANDKDALTHAAELVSQYGPGVTVTEGNSLLELKAEIVDNLMMQDILADMNKGKK